jgi:hypothetical protein
MRTNHVIDSVSDSGALRSRSVRAVNGSSTGGNSVYVIRSWVPSVREFFWEYFFGGRPLPGLSSSLDHIRSSVKPIRTSADRLHRCEMRERGVPSPRARPSPPDAQTWMFQSLPMTRAGRIEDACVTPFGCLSVARRGCVRSPERVSRRSCPGHIDVWSRCRAPPS